MEPDVSYATWGEPPEACPQCGCTSVVPGWGQCLRCGKNDKMWNCGLEFTHGWPYAGHVCGPPLDRRPSWDQGQ